MNKLIFRGLIACMLSAACLIPALQSDFNSQLRESEKPTLGRPSFVWLFTDQGMEQSLDLDSDHWGEELLNYSVDGFIMDEFLLDGYNFGEFYYGFGYLDFSSYQAY